jgi:hypothetical protein
LKRKNESIREKRGTKLEEGQKTERGDEISINE